MRARNQGSTGTERLDNTRCTTKTSPSLWHLRALHTEVHDPFIQSQLASRNQVEGLTWCKFRHDFRKSKPRKTAYSTMRSAQHHQILESLSTPRGTARACESTLWCYIPHQRSLALEWPNGGSGKMMDGSCCLGRTIPKAHGHLDDSKRKTSSSTAYWSKSTCSSR